MKAFSSIIAGLVGIVLLGYSQAGSALGNRPLIVPPDLVTSIEITEPATVNAEGDIELTIGVAVENQGRSDAGIFKIAIEYATPKGAFVAPFTVPEQSNNWYPYTSDPLVPRGVVKFKGKVILPSSWRGETISLNAIADSCSGDEFMEDYCRVKESNEENNKSNTLTVQASVPDPILDPTPDPMQCSTPGPLSSHIQSVADLGSLPDGMTIYWPIAPSIEREVNIRALDDFQNLFDLADKTRTRFYFHVDIDQRVFVNTPDVEIVILPTIKLRNIVLDASVHRVRISGGEVGQISAVRTPSGTNDSGFITDVLIDNIVLNSDPALCPINTTGGYNPYPNECFGIMLRGVRRLAIVNSSINSLVYPVYADTSNEDIIIANNRMHSTLGTQATVRMHDSVKTVTAHNRLTNGDSSTSDWRHNYRIHGTARYAYAACNLLVNSGVMVGEGLEPGVPEDIRYYWFNDNQFHQLAPSLYQMGTSTVHNVQIRGNRAYSTQDWHWEERGGCFYCPDNPPDDWEITDNVTWPYVQAPD